MEKKGNLIYLNPSVLDEEVGLHSLEEELSTVLEERERITQDFSEKRIEIKQGKRK